MLLDVIRRDIREELTPDPKEKGKYICPLCGSGSHGKSSDGAFSIDHDGIHGKCFACGFYGDRFDLVAQRDRISLAEATKALIERNENRPVKSSAKEPPAETLQDFSSFLKDCHDALKGSPGETYLLKRGFTEKTMERFNLGFCLSPHHLPSIVIPHNREGNYYTYRTIDDSANPKHDRPAGVPSLLFNTAALYQSRPCFVVESQLCAISIEQEGGAAVALGGVAGKNALLNLLDKQKPSAVLILSLDNDQAGMDAQEKLAEDLKGKHIPFIAYNVAGECKDPNELLQKDWRVLRQNVAAATQAALDSVADAAAKEKAEYMSRTAAAVFPEFEAYLSANAKRPPVPTGFPSLDGILNGGLTAGLYIMGAISSLGKTSWMLNIADNIAAAGKDVLYFSLEMSRHELMAKSISRISFQQAGKRETTTGEAFTTFAVLNSQGASHLSLTQEAALREAMGIYTQTIGPHMWIFSGVSSISVEEVAQHVEDHIRITGNTPVVFIDYLQILAPEDIRSTDKQNTDRAVVKLKNMSATHDIPVFCISSLNRSNYSEPINMAAFKESGAIEYGSDVLIGLQLYGIGYEPNEKQNAHADRVRRIIEKAEKDQQTEIEVRVLKNRNGQRGGSGKLLFDKKYNSFIDVPEDFTPVYEDNPFEDGNTDNDGWETVTK